MIKHRLGGLVLAVTLLMTVVAAPALAVQDSGSKNCSPFGAISVRSYGTYTVRHYVDYNDWEYTASNGSSWIVRYNHEPDVNNTWRVTSTGALDDPGTYAYCSGV